MPLKFENSYLNLPELLYSKVVPEVFNNSKLVIVNKNLCEKLSINYSESKLLKYFSGQELINSNSIALAYSGHQFGHYAPILGDGRAVLLGDFFSNNQSYDLQLKGSGTTPYSRRGDGRAPLSATLREYLLSEAMCALNIPTTRALGVVKTNEKVIRQTEEPGGIIARIAKTHLRFGTFEFVRANGSSQDLKELADYSIKRLYPEFIDSKDKYTLFLNKIIEKKGALIAKWMSKGFIHGVMNTDNMSIASETIDYGPCAFLNYYGVREVYSYIDNQGRYSYSNQPKICLWNLARFAESILPLLSKKEEDAIEIAEKALNSFLKNYNLEYIKNLSSKLGFSSNLEEKYITLFLNILKSEKLDFTLSFKYLEHQLKPINKFMPLFNDFDKSEKLKIFIKEWIEKLDKEVALKEMSKSNPFLIPRNHLVNEALFKASLDGDLSYFIKLHKLLNNPFSLDEKADIKYYSPPKKGEDIQNTFCGT